MKAKKTLLLVAVSLATICGATATAAAAKKNQSMCAEILKTNEPTTNGKALYSNGSVFCCKPLDNYNCSAANCD